MAKDERKCIDTYVQPAEQGSARRRGDGSQHPAVVTGKLTGLARRRDHRVEDQQDDGRRWTCWGSPGSGPTVPHSTDHPGRVPAKCQEVAEICKAYPGRIFGSSERRPQPAPWTHPRQGYDFRGRAHGWAASPTAAQRHPVLPHLHQMQWAGRAHRHQHRVPGPDPLRQVPAPPRPRRRVGDLPRADGGGHPQRPPWHLRTVALLQKHANFRLMTSGFVPKYVPQEIVDAGARRRVTRCGGTSYPSPGLPGCVNETYQAAPAPQDPARY